MLSELTEDYHDAFQRTMQLYEEVKGSLKLELTQGMEANLDVQSDSV